MGQRRRGRSRQAELFVRSTRPTIPIEANHRLVMLTDALDWTELEELVERIRRRTVKNDAGRPPHLRTTIGAVVLMGTQKVTLRHAEDLIRHYAPARYLCGLTETDWSPDFTTIHDFTRLLGEDGLREINEAVVRIAVVEGLADPTVMVADTTAQEAAIPYPNEMGLMAAYVRAVGAASRRAGHALQEFAKKTAGAFTRAKATIRGYRLFAKTKAAKDTVTAEMARLIGGIQVELGQALHVAEAGKERVTKYAKVARAKVSRLHETIRIDRPRDSPVLAEVAEHIHQRVTHLARRGEVAAVDRSPQTLPLRRSVRFTALARRIARPCTPRDRASRLLASTSMWT